jgi:hypothetical protein
VHLFDHCVTSFIGSLRWCAITPQTSKCDIWIYNASLRMVNRMHLLLRDRCAQLVVVRPYRFGRFVRQGYACSHWTLSRPHNPISKSPTCYLQSPATTPTSAHILLPLPPEIANMSDGEIEVESPAGYAVLPKEVTDEIGSIKLFNKARPSRTSDTHTILTLCSGAMRRSRSAISL